MPQVTATNFWGEPEVPHVIWTCTDSQPVESNCPPLVREASPELTDLGNGLFAATTANADPVDDDALLGSVTQPPGLVGPGRTCQPQDTGELTVFPAPDSQQKPQHVTLLLLPELLHILRTNKMLAVPAATKGSREPAVRL